jgi:hypothetical protein
MRAEASGGLLSTEASFPVVNSFWCTGDGLMHSNCFLLEHTLQNLKVLASSKPLCLGQHEAKSSRLEHPSLSKESFGSFIADLAAYVIYQMPHSIQKSVDAGFWHQGRIAEMEHTVDGALSVRDCETNQEHYRISRYNIIFVIERSLNRSLAVVREAGDCLDEFSQFS